MANFSPYLRALMLARVFTPEAYPMAEASEVLIALTTEVPLVNASVSDLAEPVSGNYSRAPYLLSAASWAATGFGLIYNTDAIFFPVVTSSWGRIAGWAMIDPANNEVLLTGEMLDPFITTIGMVPTIDAGTITLG